MGRRVATARAMPRLHAIVSRLVAPSASLIVKAISAMSILDQQSRPWMGLGSIVSAQGAKISNVSESVLTLVPAP